MARNRYKPEEIVMNLCPSRCLGTRSLRLCITGNCRTLHHPIPSPGDAMSNNRPEVRTSSCSCVNAKGMAGVKPFRTTATATPATEVMNRNDP